MENAKPVAPKETMESLDNQKDAQTSALPDDDWMASSRSVPDFAMPIELGAESATADRLLCTSYVENWLTDVWRNQEKLIESLVPSGLSVVSASAKILSATDKVMPRLDRFQDLGKAHTNVAKLGSLGAATALQESVAIISTTSKLQNDLQRLREYCMSVVRPDDFGISSSVSEMAAIVNSTEAWAEILQQYRKELVGFGDRWLRQIGSMRETLKAFADFYNMNQEHFRSCCMTLAKRGWFLDPHMPMSLLSDLADTIEENPAIADEILMQWFQERLDEIEAELVRASPKRAHILRSAFNAHREEDYYNSVPAFLKEADGMWHDLFGENVFLAKARKSIAQEVEAYQPYGFISSSLVPLLRSTLPLWMNKNQQEEWMKMHRTDALPGLNRHEILHGNSVDYGTETNSLKAVSFLNWRLLVELIIRVSQ